MKKLVQCLLMTVALGMPGVVTAQEEESPASEAAAKEQGGDTPEELQRRLDELEKQVAELKDASKSFGSRYERFKRDIGEAQKRIEDAQQRVQEKEAALKEVSQQGYQFEIVPESGREVYESEGREKVEKVTRLLNGKEAEQVEGVEMFEPLFEEYQGIPGFKAAFDQYKKVIARCEKKWTAARDKVQRDRQRLSAGNRTKAEANEQSVYERMAKKMESRGKDVEKDWFVPTANTMLNLKLLDALLQKARQAQRITSASLEDDAEKVTELMREYWKQMDQVVEKMRAGEPEKASEMLQECESYNGVVSAGRRSVPEKYKKEIRDQHQKLREEVRRRVSAQRRALSDVERERRALESAISRFNTAMDNMNNALETEREDLARKAEEEAERRAEEEEERRAAEEEEAEEGASAKETTKETTKKKKKSKKKLTIDD